MDILQVIQQLEQVRGKKQLDFLKASESDLLRDILIYTYNPTFVYGVKELALKKATSKPFDFNDFFMMLDVLTKAKGVTATMKANLEDYLATTGDFQELCHRILMKDLLCGLKIKKINQAFPGMLPEYEVMKAEFYDPKKVTYPCIVDIKEDGIRCTAFASPHAPTTMLTSNGLPIEGYQHVKDQLQAKAQRLDITFEADGELMVGMFGSRKEREETTDFIIFDIIKSTGNMANRLIDIRESDLLATRLFAVNQLVTRFGDLGTNLKSSNWSLCKSEAELDTKYEAVLADGGEGLMIKQLSSIYERKRTWTWMKRKPVNDIDLPITGYYAGKGKYLGSLGGFVVDYNGKSVRVPSGKGINMTKRAELWTNRDKLIGETLEIQYLEITPARSLRHPRFTRIREDK